MQEGGQAAGRSPSRKKKNDGVVRHFRRSLNSSLVPSFELPGAGRVGEGQRQAIPPGSLVAAAGLNREGGLAGFTRLCSPQATCPRSALLPRKDSGGSKRKRQRCPQPHATPPACAAGTRATPPALPTIELDENRVVIVLRRLLRDGQS